MWVELPLFCGFTLIAHHVWSGNFPLEFSLVTSQLVCIISNAMRAKIDDGKKAKLISSETNWDDYQAELALPNFLKIG